MQEVNASVEQGLDCGLCFSCRVLDLRDECDEALDANGYDGGVYYRAYIRREDREAMGTRRPRSRGTCSSSRQRRARRPATTPPPLSRLSSPYWIDDLDTYYDVRTGDLRNTDVLETYIRDHADLAMAIDLKSSRRHGGGLVSPFLGGYDLDQDFARITQVFGGPTQADAYAAPRRAELLAERDRLRARIATIDGLLR